MVASRQGRRTEDGADEKVSPHFLLAVGAVLALIAAVSAVLGNLWHYFAEVMLWIVGIALAIQSIYRIRGPGKKPKGGRGHH